MKVRKQAKRPRDSFLGLRRTPTRYVQRLKREIARLEKNKRFHRRYEDIYMSVTWVDRSRLEQLYQ